MGFIWFVLGCLCAAIAIKIYFVVDDGKFNFDKFEKEQQKIIGNLKQKRDDFDTQEKKRENEVKTKVDLQIEALLKQETEARKSYEDLKEGLQEEFEDKQQWYKEQEQSAAIARAEANEKEIAAAAQKKQEKLSEIDKAFSERQKALASEYELYSASIKNKMELLDKEIQDYEDKQKAIIEQFKKDEEAKQQQDFYRIKLSDNDIEDVVKLRRVADTLNNPTILYKLIWENYYKTKFSELVGRVAPNKKCGIYKITNLINGKIYIGQTKQSFNDRWRSHVRRGLKAEPGTSNKLYAAMWEDGVENFSFEVLLECKPEELNEKERYFIQFFKSQEWGYNSTGGNK